MKTYTQLLDLYKTFTVDTTQNETFGRQMLGDSFRTIGAIKSWYWLETLISVNTLADRQTYIIPNNIKRVTDVYLQQGTAEGSPVWFPELVYDYKKWKQILSMNLGSGDVPRYIYIQNRTIYISPIPQTNGNKLYIRGKINIEDQEIDDYSAGTITETRYNLTFTGTLASGATSGTLSASFDLEDGTYLVTFSNGDQRLATFENASTSVTWTSGLSSSATATITVQTENGGDIITGSGTTWIDAMVGRYLQIDLSTGGDNAWYKITKRYSNTVIAIETPYTGTDIASGSANYIIGQVSPIPEPYQIAPVYRSAAIYWQDKGEENKANRYWRLYDGGNEAGLTQTVGGILGQMMEAEAGTMDGAYMSPVSVTGRINPNNPEPRISSTSF